MTSFAERSVALADGEVAYLEWPGPGPDAPIVHFAHGTGLNGRSYARLLAPISERFRVLAWDARGHGRTRLPANPATLIDWGIYVDDLARFLAAVAPGRPVLVAGHSLGGVTSLEMASAHATLAAATLAVEPPLVPEDEVPVLEVLRTEGRTRPVEVQMGERALRRRADWPSHAAAIEGYRGRGAFATWDEGSLEDYVAGGLLPEGDNWRLACSPAWEAKTYHAISTRFWRRLAALDCPATIMHGDRMSPVSQPAIASIDRIGHARRILVPGATHFLPMEHPDMVRAEIHRLADEAGL
jgi:pimeloyl-ACP methyl ester carboxylesterase